MFWVQGRSRGGGEKSVERKLHTFPQRYDVRLHLIARLGFSYKCWDVYTFPL